MLEFELNFGKWLKIKGGKLKGRDLAYSLVFLAFIFAVIVIWICKIDLSNVQIQF